MRTGIPDPITLDIIQNSLQAAGDEMFEVLKRAAMSPIIYEVLDVGTGVTDANGELVSSGAGIPTFVGVLDKAVKRIIEIHGLDAVGEGDLFITNDPYHGGVTHLNDVVITLPVFAAGELVAWAASIAHWNDVGGKTPGSMAVDVSEIFQEGLRLPAVKLLEHGTPIDSVFKIIAANTRLPEFVQGDLWAQVAASRKAEARIKQIVKTYGLSAYHAALSALFDEGEKRAQAGLATLPTGTYSLEEVQDDDAVWKVAITVTAQRFTVDLRGNPEQRSAPFNTSRDGAVISAQMIFKALTDPTLFASGGSFRPLEVITEPGTIFHATGTAPHGYYFETRIRLYDMLWQCLARALPERLPAGHFGSICGTVIAGEHPDTGRRYTMVEPQMGGWGATSSRDGLDAMYSGSHGETFNCPAEICEARYGIEVAYKRLNDTGEGGGRYCGGKGLSVSYRPRARAVLSAGLSRTRRPVWGLNCGSDGGRNRLSVIRRDGSCEEYAFVSGLAIEAGDEVVITTANGGGWGLPWSRMHARDVQLPRLRGEDRDAQQEKRVKEHMSAVSAATKEPEPEEARAAEVGGRYSKYVLVVLALVYVFEFIDRQILSILAEDIKADLGVSDAQLGFLYGTAFAVFYAVFGIPLGRLADTWIRKRLISIGLVFWSLMTVLSGTARSFGLLACYRIGVGIGEASNTPAAFSMLSDYFPPRLRTTVMAIYASGTYIGLGIGVFLGGMILGGWAAMFPTPADAPLGLKGWHVAFFVVGIPGILMSVWVWSLREPARGQSEGLITPPHPYPFRETWGELNAILPPLNLLKLISLGGGTGAIAINLVAGLLIATAAWFINSQTNTPVQWIALGIGVYCAFSWAQALALRDPATFAMIFRCRTLSFGLLGFACMSFVLYGLLFWGPPFFQRVHGVSAAESGTVLGLSIAIGGALGVTLGGVIADWLQARSPRGKLYVGVASATVSLPLATGFLLADGLGAAYVMYFLCMVTSPMYLGPAAATVNDLVMPRMRGIASAVYILILTFVGLALGPYTIGQISDTITGNGDTAATALRQGMLWSLLAGVLAIALLTVAARHVERDQASRLERARAWEKTIPSYSTEI